MSAEVRRLGGIVYEQAIMIERLEAPSAYTPEECGLVESLRTQLAESQEQVAMLREALVKNSEILVVLNTVWGDKFSPEMVSDINDHTNNALSILAATQPKEVNDEIF
jgi:hypothetical protein